jgi:hypothetical protein
MAGAAAASLTAGIVPASLTSCVAAAASADLKPVGVGRVAAIKSWCLALNFVLPSHLNLIQMRLPRQVDPSWPAQLPPH